VHRRSDDIPVSRRLGHAVGASLYPPEYIGSAQDGLATAFGSRGRLELPRYAEIAAAATVFWNGPMGRFELAPFASGTLTVAEAVASTRATTVVRGGETVEAMRSFGLEDRVSHLSTGGGATLEFLEGRELPGVHALLRTAAGR